MPTELREPKPDWSSVPEPLRAVVAKLAGGPITDAQIVWGGYGPSATFVLATETGSRAFCKGTHPGQTRQGHAALLKERENYERFPELAPFIPRYRGGADHGDWHMAVFDFAPATRRVPPWTKEAVHDTLALLARFHAATPLRAAGDPSLQANSQIFYGERGWKTLLPQNEERARFTALFDDPSAADAWLSQHGERIATLAEQPVGGPRSWLHLDIRSDNLVFTADHLYLVDWPLLSYGPTLSDIAAFLPSLEGEGGPRCADALKMYDQIADTRFEAADIARGAAAVAGFFAARAGEPDIAGLPRLRWIQKLQLFPALDWLSDSLGIERPPLRKPLAA